MQIEERRVGTITILSVTGEFDARTLTVATGKLDALLGEFRSRIVFNLSRLEIVTSTAIGFLVDATKRTREFGGGLVVSAPSRLFRSTVDTLRIGDVITMTDSDEEAAAILRPPEEDQASDGEEAEPRGRRSLRWLFGRHKRGDV